MHIDVEKKRHHYGCLEPDLSQGYCSRQYIAFPYRACGVKLETLVDLSLS